MSKAKSYTDLAAHVIQHIMGQTTLAAELTGQPTALKAENVRIVTGNDYNSEGLAIYLDIPQLHDIGVNSAGNAAQKALLEIPALAKHFKFRRNGISGEVISKQITEKLAPLGIDPTPFATWEGLDDKTETPSVSGYTHEGIAHLSITPATKKEEQADACAETPFKKIAHEVEAKHDAIMQTIVQKAAAMKKDNGSAIFTPEQLEALAKETLRIKNTESGNYWSDISMCLGTLKTDEATAKKSPDQITAEDLTKSVLSELPEKCLTDLLFDAVLENVPSAYPNFASAERVRTDLEKAVQGKADISEILQCAQFSNSRGPIFYRANENDDRFADINTPDGADHPNTLKIDFDLPKGVKATDITRGILEYGVTKGILKPSEQKHVMTSEQARQTATSAQPANSVEKPSLFGRIAGRLGLGQNAA